VLLSLASPSVKSNAKAKFSASCAEKGLRCTTIFRFDILVLKIMEWRKCILLLVLISGSPYMYLTTIKEPYPHCIKKFLKGKHLKLW
jgi:hypothetical protein